jgi:DNA-binding MarR family transcriptional regulator
VLGCRPQTLREVASHHHVTPSTMSRTIDGLVQRGWVARQDNPRDRREVILTLTDTGRAAMEEMDARMRDTVAAVLGRLSEDDLARLYDGLRVLDPLVSPEDAAPERERRGKPATNPATAEHRLESVTQ